MSGCMLLYCYFMSTVNGYGHVGTYLASAETVHDLLLLAETCCAWKKASCRDCPVI